MVRGRSYMSKKNVQKLFELMKQRTHCRDPETSNTCPWCCRVMPEASSREPTSLSFIPFIKNGFFLGLPFSHCFLINWSPILVHLFGEAWFHLYPSCKSSWEGKLLTGNVESCLKDAAQSQTCEVFTLPLLLHTTHSKAYNYIMPLLSTRLYLIVEYPASKSMWGQ